MAAVTHFASRLQDVSSDVELEHILNSNLNKLIIVFFYSTTCQTCERIRPDIMSLSGEMTSHLFLHVDVENCLTTAKKYDLQSIPSFLLFFNKKLLEKVEASTGDSVAQAIARRSGDLLASGQMVSGPSVPGQSILSGFLDKKTCECLNDSTEHPFSNLFNLSDSYTETDCDEQLLLTIGFNQEVKLHSICFRAPDLKHAPRSVKLFINMSSLDFDFVERATPTQFINLTEGDLEENSVTPLDFLKFQRVQTISVFVKDNQGGEEITQVRFIGLFGSTKESSNMQEFKRIAGKAGESH